MKANYLPHLAGRVFGVPLLIQPQKLSVILQAIGPRLGLRLGLEVGRFIHIDLGGANEEYVHLLAVDPDNQTFDAIVTGDHLAGESVRPAIWPTAIMNEGDDLAFDILAVASPDPSSDLTVVIQT